MKFPPDFNQIPDIFINVYTGKDERFAYLRIKPIECLHTKPKPNWYRLNSPFNDTQDENPGLLLMNVQFLRYNEKDPTNPERKLKVKDGEQ